MVKSDDNNTNRPVLKTKLTSNVKFKGRPSKRAVDKVVEEDEFGLMLPSTKKQNFSTLDIVRDELSKSRLGYTNTWVVTLAEEKEAKAQGSENGKPQISGKAISSSQRQVSRTKSKLKK